MANLCNELKKKGKCNGYKCVIACDNLVQLKRIKRKLEKRK